MPPEEYVVTRHESFRVNYRQTMLLASEASHADGTPPLASPTAIPKFERHDEFFLSLKRRVDQYFQNTHQSPRDCWQMYVKTAVILTWFASSYAFLVIGPVSWWTVAPACASLGLAMSAIGFSIQHDGSHRGYSRFSIINRMAAWSLDMLGGSSYYWARKHNVIHHTYPNITGHDDDIELGILGRLSPHQKYLSFHRLQHFYLWFLYGFIAIKWQFYDDFRDLLRGRIGVHSVVRPKGQELAIFLIGKVFFIVMGFVVPMMLHPWWQVLAVYMGVSFFQGVMLSIVFQMAHCVEEAAFPMPESDTGRMVSSFAIHQIETTVDFAPNNLLLSWFVGGLNYQIEHHLFPQVCHIHYRAISPLVRETCQEFGIRYNVHPSFMSGLASHYRWLRRLALAEGHQPGSMPV